MVEFTEKARADLDDILDYTLSEYGLEQAERYVTQLQATFNTLEAQPRLARERPEFTPPVRIHHHAHHLIVYLVKDTGGLLIVRVLHERMDPESHLQTN